MNTPSLTQWADHLESIARSAAPDAGEALLLCPWFALWLGADASKLSEHEPDAEAPDDRLWAAMTRPAISDDAIEELLTDATSSTSNEPTGSLLRARFDEAIEVTTERELSALHALWRLSVIRRRPDWRRRVYSSARWHIDCTQPDNATNRPWALHVFLLLWHDDDLPDARLFAETLLHNCQMTAGVPDALSAAILMDSASALREAIASGDA